MNVAACTFPGRERYPRVAVTLALTSYEFGDLREALRYLRIHQAKWAPAEGTPSEAWKQVLMALADGFQKVKLT